MPEKESGELYALGLCLHTEARWLEVPEKQAHDGGRIRKKRHTLGIHWSRKGKGNGESFSSRTQDYV